jgi:glycerol-3-phosphate acyltransferase PlsY
MWWALIVSAIAGYLIGSVQVGLLVGRATRGIDIRDYGSGATGATNVIRTSGWKAGVFVIVADVGKGVAAVFLARGLGALAGVDVKDDRAWLEAAAALAAVAGHVWPLYAGFRGGKAVASGFGAALSMNPLASVAMLPIAALVVASVRIMSVMSVGMSVVMAALFIALAALDVSPPAYAVYAAGASALIVYRHRANIERLIAGTEPKIGRGGDRRPDAEAAPTATGSGEPGG